MWETDYRFRLVARLVWPDDVKAATRLGRGRAAMHRIMQARYEGWQALMGIKRLRTEIDDVLASAGVKP